MTAARVIMSGSAGRGGFVVLSDLGDRLRVVVREHMGPADLRVDLDGAAGETPADLRARADRQLEEQRLIAETVAQPWLRCGGETPDQAHTWQAAGFVDAEVVAWLDVGVFGSRSAFARGELTLEQVLAEARPC